MFFEDLIWLRNRPVATSPAETNLTLLSDYVNDRLAKGSHTTTGRLERWRRVCAGSVDAPCL